MQRLPWTSPAAHLSYAVGLPTALQDPTSSRYLPPSAGGPPRSGLPKGLRSNGTTCFQDSDVNATSGLNNVLVMCCGTVRPPTLAPQVRPCAPLEPRMSDCHRARQHTVPLLAPAWRCAGGRLTRTTSSLKR